MSKNVVVAGAGALGKHVLDALLATDEFSVTVFSRSAKPELEAKGAKVQVVDYTSAPSLLAALNSSGTDTILSYIVDLLDQDSQGLATRNLLSAAVDCPTVRRFVPAEYANDLARFPEPPTCEWDKLPFREELRKKAAAKIAGGGGGEEGNTDNDDDDDHGLGSSLEYTLISIGIFMDFFVPNGKKKYFPDGEGLPIDIQKAAIAQAAAAAAAAGGGEGEGEKGEKDTTVVIKATIPGNPGDKISFTTGDDVAEGVVRLLRQPYGSWDEYTYLSGDRLTWEEVARSVEKVTGYQVRREYVGVGELAERTRKARENQTTTGAVDWGLFVTELYEYFGNTSETLPANSRCFEGMETTKLRDWIERWYGC